ncbi:AAA domain-containing protein [Dactylosporangium sp. CA-139114]|uniref:AAA domain-containing protein n=1 Tax=Dactylosporangium sp. CA-139114 TaxID=3239931 RepID=UPI003D967329
MTTDPQALIDRLFCRPQAPYGRFVSVEPARYVVDELIVQGRLRQHEEEYEVTVFLNIDGFAGELWERSAKTMLRLKPLGHSGLPAITDARFVRGERLAFTRTETKGRPIDLAEAVRWAAANPLAAFEQFTVLLDALRQLHGARIMHRRLTPDAIRFDLRGDDREVELSLARFEMSTLIGNIIRRVVSGDVNEVRTQVRRLYTNPAPPVGRELTETDRVRHFAYLAPEMHTYIFDDRQHSRRDWESTDIFGLGVFGWELFCGGIPQVLPDELAAVAGSDGVGRIQALAVLHRAMHTHLTERAALPARLKALLRNMLSSRPGDRKTSFELSRRVEGDWDAIRGDWEEMPDKPFLVAFMPDESADYVYNHRRWISRSPTDAAGREELKAFFEQELAQAALVHSRFGARGYATGPDEVLAQAEWILIGVRAVWFCAYLREYGISGQEEHVHEDVLLIKYLREHEYAQELFTAQPRRRVPSVDIVAFRPGQNIDFHRKGRPSWRRLTESVRRLQRRNVLDEEFLQSVDFLLDYQRVVLDARTYPFRTADGMLLTYDERRDDAWRHRNPLLVAYAADPARRPAFGDFVQRLDSESELVLLDVDSRTDTPGFVGTPRVARFMTRRDANTIEVMALDNKPLPPAGWLRPHEDSGSRPQLSRQIRARQSLQNLSGLVTTLRAPSSFDLGRNRWSVERTKQLLGNAAEIVEAMLSYEPFYALQGPPGSGKTNTIAQALLRFVKAEGGARVLVSAQSNHALDNLAEKLVATLPTDVLVLREAAEGKEKDTVGKSIQPYTIDNLTSRLARDIEDELAGREEPPPGADEKTVEGAKLAKEWRDAVTSSQVELTERIRTGTNVVLATCSIAATLADGADSLTDAFDWVIVEEAAKAWPTEIVIPLVLGSRWTLVGDHRQIGAFRREDVRTFLQSLALHPDEKVKQHYRQMAGRLEALDLFATIFRTAGSLDGLGHLNRQFRMHPTIAEPVSRAFYPLDPPEFDNGLPRSFLETDESARQEHGVVVPHYLAGRPLVWLDTRGYPNCVDQPTWSNDGEVELIDKMVDQMSPAAAPPGHEGDTRDSLVVLTPYRAQVKKLERRDVLRNRVHTVHSFQGRQAQRVVVSLVRTRRVSDDPAHNVGHVGQDEVANVLLSRARRLLVLVGDFEHFAENAGPTWRLLTRVIERFGHIERTREWLERS